VIFTVKPSAVEVGVPNTGVKAKPRGFAVTVEEYVPTPAFVTAATRNE
jgi:hypothetical protein